MSEACADIWAAIITNKIYPTSHDKIWKIGEDIVLPASGKTCVRNLADPTDVTAVTQMFSNNCQSTAGTAYECSGVISHWFYLLTHGYSWTGCDGMCYTFPALPMDSAAKLLYYCETTNFFSGMEYSDICQATLNAAVNFSDPESIRVSILGAWNVVGVKPLVTGIGEFGLSYSSVNDRSYYVDKDLVVDSLRTLTIRGTVHFCDTCSVIIYPGSKLVIEGGRLTNACPNDLWQGIEVVGDRTKRQLAQYQGTVELRNGATIENAHCAIRTGLAGEAGYATAGGIIRAEDAHFVNNRRSVDFLSYTNHALNGGVANNQSYFSNCSFTVNDNNLFSQNSVSFIDHVTLWDVRGIDFNGCTFGNATTTQGDRRHAIYAEDAGFTVDKRCTDPIINPNTCTCNTFVRSEFSGFTTAIEVNTTGEQAPVKVDFANFINNVTAMCNNGNNYASFTRCDYNMTNAPYIMVNNGLVLNGCSGYKVEENRFHKPSKNNGFTSTGICVIENGVTNNSIYRNTFDTLDYGIHVTGINGDVWGGLQMTAGKHRSNTYGIYITTGATVCPWQGSLSKGADNRFFGAQTSSLYNLGCTQLTYYHSSDSVSFFLVNPMGVYAESNLAATNPCTSTLCSGGLPPFPFTDFQSGMNAYTSALVGNANADETGMDVVETQNFASPQQDTNETLAGMRRSLSETYYEAVRALMSDTVLDLSQLEQWHAAAQPIADPYSLTETRFMMGYDEPFLADAENAELANYAEFHAMKLALRINDDAVGANNYSPLQPGGHINWYALTPAQIAQLQTIAERNTGRASVMAKGVLCFFFGICYDDPVETQDFASLQRGDDGNDTTTTHAKRATTDIAGDAALTVYPNPTDDLLYIELIGAGIATVALYDLQGRTVTGVGDTPQQGTATINMRNIPAGVYILHVTDGDRKEYQQKIVRR
ncbi:MAG: M4 family metallopeptidase [Bacteroidales bacterium]|nr:M4 family metallopeptidase [Bacteroidales bacterium]